VAAFLRDPEGTITTNVLGLARCLEVARDGASVVFISSSEAYGDETRVPLREDLTTRVRTDHPRACYEQAKLAGEALLFAARQSGVRGVAVRLFTTYGERLGLDRRMMGTFVMAALTGVPLLVDGGGGQLQTACYVGDIVEGLIRLARLGDFPSPINLGSPEGRPVREIAEAVVETLKSPSRIDVAPPRPGPDARVPSIDRVRQLTGWSPTAPLQEGVERMAEFYRRFRKGNEGWELTK
jgi:nucleoside-diphosphate-sugar epimerase